VLVSQFHQALVRLKLYFIFQILRLHVDVVWDKSIVVGTEGGLRGNVPFSFEAEA